VDSNEPLTIVCGFLPVLQPMWPAGIGGQFAYWDNNLKAYIISESTGKNHGFIGSPAASGLSYTPAHMLSDAPNEFQIKVADPDSVKDKFIPVYLAGGSGDRNQVLQVYKKLQESPEKFYQDNCRHYLSLQNNTLSIKTPNLELDMAFRWAKVAFDNLIVDNPALGKGMVAGLGASGTSGRPGFGWFFGGDAYINSFSLSSYGAHTAVREILAFTHKWQREDGKMAHELSQADGYVDWWEDYNYGYIHGDTTPFYIAAMYDYLRLSGDIDFIKESWAHLEKAFRWCLSTDANGDGLMDNRRAGLGALEYGALTGIETDIYLAAVWVRAALGMKHLADAAGKQTESQTASQIYTKAKEAFENKFWDEENRFYAYAFNAKGERVKEISPWNAVGLMWGWGKPERSLLSLERICSSELTTDWGIRSISTQSQYFQPLNYNYGAVWPFLTSWVTTALFKNHLPLQGYNLLLATAKHTFDNALGVITEVFSGTQNVWPQEAVAHQGFSTAGVVLPTVRGLLGLEGDALEKSIVFSPHFPADWQQVKVENYKVGTALFNFDYIRSQGEITLTVKAKNADGYKIHFAPALGVASRIQAMTLNGEPVDYSLTQGSQTVQPGSVFPVEGETQRIDVDFIPSLEILHVLPQTKVGDPNTGLKILSIHKEGALLEIELEGIANLTYSLRILNPKKVDSLTGAELHGDRLQITMPEGRAGEFVPHKISIQLGP
jgi:hypothetical protein